jgi:Uma2 family endonuclease
MSVLSSTPPRRPPAELHSGDQMTRQEFHEIYSRMPESFRAELIGGTVYVASPLGLAHGTSDLLLITAFTLYAARTPGVQASSNATVFLGNDSEPQPDVVLRVLPECGGQSRTTPQGYVDGAPELIAEIAHSSRAIDLGPKRMDYARYGVLEYVVVSLHDQQFQWFHLGKDSELQPGPDGVLKLITFPGLWIDSEALLAQDLGRLQATLERGIASPERSQFAAKLASSRK